MHLPPLNQTKDIIPYKKIPFNYDYTSVFFTHIHDRHGTGCHWLSRLLHLNKTHPGNQEVNISACIGPCLGGICLGCLEISSPAVSSNGKPVVVAKPRNLDTNHSSSLQHSGSWVDQHLLAIDEALQLLWGPRHGALCHGAETHKCDAERPIYVQRVHILVEKFRKPGEAASLPCELQHLDCQTQAPRQKNWDCSARIRQCDFV